MIRTILTVFALLALGAGSLQAKERHKREAYRWSEIFQNVAAEHVVPLLGNTARVTHWHDGEGELPRGGHVRIVWYGANGKEYRCLQGKTGESDEWAAVPYFGVITKSEGLREPLKKAIFEDGDGYQMLRYDGDTGGLTTFIGWRNRLWEADVGHLQERLPAVIWDICPTFPSAESLGTTVNTKQTSRFYGELLQQDPGRRILRPEYVNEHAHEWLDR